MWQRIDKYISVLLLWLVAMTASAQSHGLEIAPRVGVYMGCGHSQLQGKAGVAVGAELDYSFRTRISRDVLAGMRVGLGISRAATKIEGTTEDRYTNYDYQHRPMAYLNTARLSDQHAVYRIELPIMAAVRFYGVSLHTGPRLQWHLADRSDFTLTDPVISATYTDYGVTLVNRVVTGVLSDVPYRGSATFTLPKGRLQWGLEAGYEWDLSQGFYSQQRLGVAVGVYYDLVTFAGSAGSDRVIDVAPIRSSVNPVPKVTVNTPAKAFSDLRGLELCVKLTYAIESIDYNGYGWHSRRYRGQRRRTYRW